MRRRKSAPLELDPIEAEVWEVVEVSTIAQTIMVTMQKEMRRTLESCSLRPQVSLFIILYGLLMSSYGFFWWVVCIDVCFMLGLGLFLKEMALERTLGLWTRAISYVESHEGRLFMMPVRGQRALRTFDSTPYLMVFITGIVLMLGLGLFREKSDIVSQLVGGFCCLILFSANLYLFLVREYIRLWYQYLIPVWKATRVSLLRPESSQ